MARKPTAIEPVQPVVVIKTPEWPDGIILNPHVFAAPEPPAPEPVPQPDIPETE